MRQKRWARWIVCRFDEKNRRQWVLDKMFSTAIEARIWECDNKEKCPGICKDFEIVELDIRTVPNT